MAIHAIRSRGLLLNEIAWVQCCVFVCWVVCGFGSCESSVNDVKASFVFGDSLVDAGNNNYIFTLSKADMPPNGIDFNASGGLPSGRFTNGRTIPDILGQEIGQNVFAPPYMAPTTSGDVLLKAGVNYASGGAGILNETGRNFIGRISMDTQLNDFANTREEIISMIGVQEAQDFLAEAIFSISIGSNDFLNNYLAIENLPERELVSPEQFIQRLIDTFRVQLTRLYNLDARKIVVANVGPIGCIPYQRDFNPLQGDGCVSRPNQMAMGFNTHLKDLIVELNANLSGAIFVYANVYDIVNDIIVNYKSYGFDVADTACCGSIGRHKGIIPCGRRSNVCPEHSEYVFWDPYHPSEATNLIIANRLLDGGPDIVSPMNVRSLAQV
ncbi:hypothetical protein SUGI_0493740 [Cryptomeria japonica]|uniref:GDSL esterase/lipase At4g16230 n=1 Tax=Cryptomeria japonica TaxID=3369 RepID=UPI002408E77D|nr:GDSL esterase/lipase At4g16230 [Cryptomeria japonica]GLJ25785.1 hypothetical protein SUGI_0493740 [Cryptomeria japonica]